ncbi:extracellular solute-binding protein [Cellulosilyticum sp. I15G10I2]|uniref:extracellular solute-binding protein n=1 Tax=Cellulosilyticum sp. I15G10I2 TaxID=1892843 RepID=UPI001A9A39D3|nr:extracellular solute-binding protein [Cellulosilyticum sp. I15G10I2]
MEHNDQSKQKKIITLYHIQEEAPIQEIIMDSIKRFEDQYPEFQVDVTVMSNDAYKHYLKIRSATKEMPDVFSTWAGGSLKELVNTQFIVNLRDYMMQDQYLDRFMDKAIEMVDYEDGIWAVPVENVTLSLVIYNKDIFSKLQLSPPETYEEFLEVIKVLRSQHIIPLALANRTGWPGSMYYMYFVDRIGGSEVFKNAIERANHYTFEDAAFVEAGYKIQELIAKNAFPEGFNWLDEDNGDARSLIYNEEAAMILTGTWFLSKLNGAKPELLEKLDVFPFPVIEEGRGSKDHYVGSVGDNFYSIASSCAYPDEAFKLIQFLIDDTAVQKRIEAGRIPPIKNTSYKEPLFQKIYTMIQNAPYVQFWYDQYLPPRLGEVHNMLMKELFDGEEPEIIARKMEHAVRRYYLDNDEILLGR